MLRKITKYLPLVFAIVLLFTTVAYAHGGDHNLIHACVDAKGGIRIVGADDTCLKKETALDWSIQGPAGEPGPAGPAGSAVTIIPITGAIYGNEGPNCNSRVSGIGGIGCIPGDLSDFGYRRGVMPMPRSGKFLSLSIITVENDLNGDTVVKMLVNGLDTGLIIHVPAGSTSTQMIEAVVPVQTGDLITLVTDGHGANTGYAWFTGAIAYTAD